MLSSGKDRAKKWIRAQFEDDNAKYRDEDGHTLHFPDDAEVEKRKRNIH